MTLLGWSCEVLTVCIVTDASGMLLFSVFIAGVDIIFLATKHPSCVELSRGGA